MDITKKISEKLSSVRAFVVVIMTITFCYAFVKGTVSAEAFITVYGVAVGFYFGKNRKEDQQNAQPSV